MVSVLSGCSKTNDKLLCLSNINDFYEEKIDDDFLVGTNESIRNLMDTKLGFILYIHDDNCSSCKNFEPIISEFSKKNANLIVEVPISNIYSFQDEFKNEFFNDEELTLPYVSIIKGNEFERVNNQKYMKTENAFKNYIHSKCRLENIFYTTQNLESLKNSKQFTHILLKNTDKTSMNLYSTNVLSHIENSKNNIVLTPNNIEFEIAQVDANYKVKEKIQVTEETESNQIAKFF